jgi:hypothetical protein
MSLNTERTCRVTVQYAPCSSSFRQYLVVPLYHTYQRAAYHLQSDLQPFGHRERYIHTIDWGNSASPYRVDEAVEMGGAIIWINHSVQPDPAPRRRVETSRSSTPKTNRHCNHSHTYHKHVSLPLFRFCYSSLQFSVEFSIQTRIRSGQSLSTITTTLRTATKTSGQEVKGASKPTGTAHFETLG